MEHCREGPLIAWALTMLSLWESAPIAQLARHAAEVGTIKKQSRKFVLLADMLPRGLAFVLICIVIFCLCLILVGLGG
jgi:hypothetical protein